jgi:ferredoxin--NADP+ reductase
VGDQQQGRHHIFTQRILEVKKWTSGLLSFSMTRPPEFKFSAGQYVRIAFAHDQQKKWRAFTIVSAPHEAQLEFFAVIIPNGLFTSQLLNLEPGDQILLEAESYGFMTPDRFVDGDVLWMLSTGTGLGPFISMLRDDKVWRKFKKLLLVQGVRHEDELAYQSELFGMQAGSMTLDQRASLQIIQCVTRCQPTQVSSALPRLNMRMTNAIQNGELEKKAHCALDATTSRVMMCGNPQMIEDVRRLLHQRGFKPCRRMQAGQFLTENYW